MLPEDRDMAAYVIADIAVKDAAKYEDYKRGVAATVEKFGGRFLIRGGLVKAFEGDWQPERLVVIEFPDLKTLEDWYRSADYAPLLALRLAASDGRLIAIEGN
jgi:uncharacterized protein (DUF1330 family)